MKPGKYSTLCALRRQFKNTQELADVINRSRPYVIRRLSGSEQFSLRERRMILKAIGKEETEENLTYYFGGCHVTKDREQEITGLAANVI